MYEPPSWRISPGNQQQVLKRRELLIALYSFPISFRRRHGAGHGIADVKPQHTHEFGT